MAKTPYILLRDAIAADLAAQDFSAPVVVVATRRPLIDLPDTPSGTALVNVFHNARRSDQPARAGVDREYDTIIAVHRANLGDTTTALEADADNFEFLAWEIETHLEMRSYGAWQWLQFETPGADKFPWIAEVYDQTAHLLSVLQVTHLEPAE